MDSGFDIDHPVFQNLSIKATWNFVHNTPDVKNPSSSAHGTSCLSLVAGKSKDFTGVAFGATVLLAKTEAMDFEEKVEEDYFVQALEWGEKLGADLVSSSLGYHQWWQFQDYNGRQSVASKAVEVAYEKGMAVFLSSGNYGQQHLATPGDSRGALSIGSVNWDKSRSFFSSIGPTSDGRIKPDLVAIGEGVYVADRNPGFTTKSGTSFSAPLVAGIGALIMEAHPEWSVRQIYLALKSTASHLNHPSIEFGWGFVNALNAVNFSPPKCESSCLHGICNEYDICVCETGFYGTHCELTPLDCHVWCPKNPPNGKCWENQCLCLNDKSRCFQRRIPDWSCSLEFYNDTKLCHFCGNTQDPDCHGFLSTECESVQPIPISELSLRCQKIPEVTQISEGGPPIFPLLIVPVPFLLIVVYWWRQRSRSNGNRESSLV